MCYATSLRKQREAIEQKRFGNLKLRFKAPSEYRPYYHLNGFTHGKLYIIKMDEPEFIYPAIWGLVPHWGAHDPETFFKKSNTLNARSESIFEKASFKDSAEDKRCLVLADGFFEPHHENGVSMPYFCYQPSEVYPEGDLFLFAGLYNELDDARITTTILTVEANAFFAEIHNKRKRMPLVLAEDLYEDWLDEGQSQPQLNELMATGFTTQEFQAHPVTRDLYKRGIDTNTPEFVKAVDKGTLF
ncbi:SOS response-associated peptidase [Aestuariivivens sediminicola]|uniref:SOS response-associated peptidase n=1 Tax=Aestuariivivens sediminicola TaxID=2913560 RepID=UPI001F594CDF|nr:SOS response-associated peptidase [Aestuariivivens sediminicola]